MTVPVDEIMRVVRTAVAPFRENRDYEDIYSEALIHAWQQVERHEWEKWSVIAWKAARWQASEYLRQRRSGRLTSQREAPIYALWLEDLPAGQQSASDGGIAQADARLQLWLWRQASPRPETLTCAQCAAPLPAKTGGRRKTYCSPRCKWQRLEALRKAKREASR